LHSIEDAGAEPDLEKRANIHGGAVITPIDNRFLVETISRSYKPT
jgi:hypothetical protein